MEQFIKLYSNVQLPDPTPAPVAEAEAAEVAAR
jgi:hypothetical protein